MSGNSPHEFEDLENDVRSESESISELFSSDANIRGRNFRIISGWLVIIGAALIGISQAVIYFSPPDNGEPALFMGAITLIGVVATAIGGLFALANDLSTPEALQHARSMEKKALKLASKAKQIIELNKRSHENMESELLEFEKENDWLVDLYILSNALYEKLESLIKKNCNISVEEIRNILNQFSRQIVQLIGFDARHLWTISIYTFTDETNSTLRCIATERSDRSDENGKRRDWQIGFGVVGEVARRRAEVVIANLGDPREARLIRMPEPNNSADNKVGDAEKYVSLAGVPIRISANENIWGVVVATSDQPGFFDIDASGQSGSEIEPLRLLAKAIALSQSPQAEPPENHV